jgi:hypothetical protein
LKDIGRKTKRKNCTFYQNSFRLTSPIWPTEANTTTILEIECKIIDSEIEGPLG